MQFSRTFARWFPVPKLLMPPAAGIDITDASVKWLAFKEGPGGLRIASCGTRPLAVGVVERGAIKDSHALAEVLKEVKKSSGISFAHAALPEEDAYVFSMHVPPGSSRSQVMNMIEFELEARVPIPPSLAVYDFDTVLVKDDHGEEIAVSVFPRDLAEGYVQAFALAGIELLSLEIEARSIARAISERTGETALLVDCGYARTGVAILRNGIPIFTSTVDIGGADFTKAVMEGLSLKSEDEARVFKNEHGLVPEAGGASVPAALEKAAGALAEEIGKHYRFWDTKRSEHGGASSVEHVFLVGGSANLKGLPEYIAGRVHAQTERPNVWRNAFSFDDYIPPIDYRASLQYATAAGLALRST